MFRFETLATPCFDKKSILSYQSRSAAQIMRLELQQFDIDRVSEKVASSTPLSILLRYFFPFPDIVRHNMSANVMKHGHLLPTGLAKLTANLSKSNNTDMKLWDKIYITSKVV